MSTEEERWARHVERKAALGHPGAQWAAPPEAAEATPLPPGTITRTEYTTLHPTRPPTPSNRRGPHHTHQRHIHTTPWTPLNNNPTDQLQP